MANTIPPSHQPDSDSGAQPKCRRVVGALLGTAMGDAIGLPYEGLSKHRGERMFGMPDRHRLFFGRGMISDDTEHACMTAQALIVSGGDPDRFAKDLARRLRYWLLALPAGVGLATARAILRLWLGFRPSRSGVFSAGNGPAMRAPIIGAAVDDLSALRALVRASTRLTHSDSKAEFGALAVALAAYLAGRDAAVSGRDFLARLDTLLNGEGEALLDLLSRAADAAERGLETWEFAAELGLGRGVSGYAYHTVPVAIHAWLRYRDDFQAAVTAVVRCGGDTDSTAAIAGGIVGAGTGEAGIPRAWRDGLLEWPRSVAWMERLGLALCAEDMPRRRVEMFPFAVLPRNVLFLAVVLFHGFRRLLPPY